MFRRGRDDSSDDDHRSAREHPFPPSEAVRDDSGERGGDHRSSAGRQVASHWPDEEIASDYDIARATERERERRERDAVTRFSLNAFDIRTSTPTRLTRCTSKR